MAEEYGLSVILRLVDRLSGPLRNVKKEFEKMEKAYDKHGKHLRSFGKDMTERISLPILGLAGLATAAAVSFDDAFAEMRKDMKAPADEIARIRDNMIAMSATTPTSAENLMGVATAAARIGMQTKDLGAFTKTVTDFANAAHIEDYKGVAQAFGQIGKVAGLSQTDYSRLASTMLELNDATNASEETLIEMASKMGGVGKVLGLSQGQVLGIASAFASLGVEGDRGGMALDKVLISMNKIAAGKDKQSIIQQLVMGKVTGLGTEGFKKLWQKDAVGALSLFINSLDKWQKKGVDAIQILDKLGMDGGRTADVLLRMVGNTDLLRKSVDVGSKAWQENTALTEEARLEYEKASSQFKIFWNNLKAIGASFGSIILPVLIRVSEFLLPILRRLEAMPMPVKRLIVVFAGFVAAAGPVIWILGTLAGSLAAIGAASATLLPLTIGMMGLAGAIVAVVTAIKALEQAWVNVRKGDLMGGTTYGLIQNAIMGKNQPVPSGTAANLTLPGMMKSATEIVLRVVGDKATAIQGVNKKKGDANVNVITQGYLGLAGAQ